MEEVHEEFWDDLYDKPEESGEWDNARKFSPSL
jgi:hypothetical protein